MDDTCVICGAYVAEGSWICPSCQKKLKQDKIDELKRREEHFAERLNVIRSCKNEH